MRAKIILASSLLIALSISIGASIFGTSGNGRLKTEARKVSGFSSIDMSGVGELHLREGRDYKVEVRLDSNLLPHYVTKNRNGVLELGFENGFSVSHVTELEVTVTLPELEDLSLSGTCAALLEGNFSGKKLSIEISGTGSVSGAIDYDRLVVDLSGTGSTKVSGRVAELALDISGAGSFEARNLEARRARLDLSGSAHVALRAAESLSIHSSGASSVTYWGDPVLDVSSSGASSVRRAN